jgi:hypothetical protein
MVAEMSTSAVTMTTPQQNVTTPVISAESEAAPHELRRIARDRVTGAERSPA